MKIEFVFVGKTSERYIEEGVVDFTKRLERHCQVTFKVIKDVRSKASKAEIIRQEGAEILKSVRPGVFLVALDPQGKQLSSEGLARQLAQWQMENRRDLALVIGGANGLSTEVRGRADYALSLSSMTFTHEMARLILIEQLYRAYSILVGSKYHK